MSPGNGIYRQVNRDSVTTLVQLIIRKTTFTGSLNFIMKNRYKYIKKRAFPGSGSGCYSEISGKCTECMKCVNECNFLGRYGSPKKIADLLLSGSNTDYHETAYECSLCGLCDSVCPVRLNPSKMFHAMRCDAVLQGIAPLKSHSGIIAYEKKGTSRFFTYYSIPENCDTVFFPGCTLTGTRPESTMAVLEILRKRNPSTGIVLDCCCKPSHDIGRMDFFNSMFYEMKAFLIESGIKSLISACPNCHKVFKTYGDPIRIESVYEILADSDLHNKIKDSETRDITIHDPCVIRNCPEIHDSVRKLARISGCSISEMKHSREKTFCCGEGGSAGAVDRNLADSWKQKRIREAEGKHIITCCAGCAGKLGDTAKTSHIIDLLLDPEKILKEKAKISKAPFTYINRFLIKRKLRKNDRSAIIRERTFKPDKT